MASSDLRLIVISSLLYSLNDLLLFSAYLFHILFYMIDFLILVFSDSALPSSNYFLVFFNLNDINLLRVKSDYSH